MGALYDELLNKPHDLETFNNIFSRLTIGKRQLTNFILELTPLCNLNCKMCYVHIAKGDFDRACHRLLTFDEWRSIIDQFAELNALNCTLSGGECTTHPDFKRIYEYAYSKKMNITVMTNGVSIGEDIFELFRKMPPLYIYLTIYGNSPETYGAVCGVPSAYDRVMKNVDRLHDEKFNLIIQYTVVKDNFDDFEAVYRRSMLNHIPVRYSSLLNNYNECDDDDIAENSVSSESFYRKLDDIWDDKEFVSQVGFKRERKRDDQTPSSTNRVIEKGITCNAGRNTCSINWRGEMQPCSSFDAFLCDTLQTGVGSAWKKLVEWADTVPQLTECQTCHFLAKCPQCFARHYNDTKEFGKPSPRLCWKLLHPEEAAKIDALYAAAAAEKVGENHGG